MDYDYVLASLEPRKCSTSFEESYKYYIRKLGERTHIGFTVKPNSCYYMLYNIVASQYCPASAGTQTRTSQMSNYPALDDEKNDVDFLIL